MARKFANGTGRSIPVLAFLLIVITALVLVAPALADPVVTIDNSSATAIADNLSKVDDGGTLILRPGVYREHDLTIPGTITIRADTASGGSAADTIIDAQGSGRIFNVTSDTGSLAVGNLALKNGAVTGENGGAVNAQGDVTITSSTIANCSADNGGAVSTQGNLTVTDSTLSGCSSGNSGGAIFSGYNTTLISSRITDCSAQYGGGIFAAGWVILSSSEISNCTAQSGGAVSAGSGGVIMESSVISGCSAQYGGAIGTDGDVTLTGSSTITNCSASKNGGAINAGGVVTVTSSSITNCSAMGNGGAILAYNNYDVTVTSSTIANCSAAYGGAVFYGGPHMLPFGSCTISFSRLVNDSSQGYAINTTFPITATKNWWGTNSPDFAAQVHGPVSYDPWLVMNISAVPSSVTTPQTSAVRVTITNTSAGTNTAAGGIFVPDKIPVAWSFTGVSGLLRPASGSLVAGAGTTTFAPSSAGNANISATVDGQTVFVPVTVTSSGSGADTSGDTGRGTSFVATAPGTTAGGTMTFAVSEPLNAGGTGYSYAITTVSFVPAQFLGATDLIVTDAGSTSHAPDGRSVAGVVVIEPVAVNPSAISSGTITFAVSGTWLSAHGLTPADVVLMRYHDGTWAELPTMYQYTSGNAYYFSATTPGFSYFAIASRNSTAAANTTATVPSPAAEITTAGSTQAPPAPVTPGAVKTTSLQVSSSVAPATTAAPAVPGANAGGSGGFPVTTVALIGAGIAVLIGAGWYIHRWWIRRQNPALFRKYD